MAIKVFCVPISECTESEKELNIFLRSHRIVTMERRFVDQGTASFWTFCVDYLDTPASNASFRGSSNRGKIDYKEVLSPEDFAVFAQLRDLRKEIAQAEAVPMYTVFTNEQLAKIVQNRVQSRADLEKVAGVGDARVAKYGDRVLQKLATAWQPK
jgi:superfamily II DNA helicase RecQ